MYLLLALCLVGAVSGRQPAPPQHSADHLPDTAFSCRDKVLGGYYADPDAQCQMFHVCVKVAGVGIQDFRFLCPNGTAFDQEAQICAGWADVACDSTALYYSSDNFDLYRIGSGFESKKAPATFEDEPDFHLQRAEPDILSGAHSSNFFNGKDNQDVSENKSKAKVQYNEPQKKKVVRKLQRRPVDNTPKASPTPVNQFTNNFAGSYNPTTSRPVAPTTIRPSSQPQQYNENYNNYNARNNNYQPARQSSTAAPNDYYKSTQDNQYSTKSEQYTPQSRNNARNFKSRTQSTPEYNYNTEGNQYNKQTTANVNYNTAAQQSSKYYDSQSYNGEQNNQQSTPKYNFVKERKQKAEISQPTTKTVYSTPSSVQYDNKQSSPAYNAYSSQDYNKQNNYNQQTTPKYNYNSESDQKYNNYQDNSNYNSKSNQQSTQQSTQQNNQQYNNNNNNYQPTQDYYNNDNTQFDKIKSTTKFAEKKQQFNNKQQSNQYNNEQQYNNQQTPTPKFNTNLQYDNNQQSTPLYNNYNGDNQQYQKSSSAPFAPQQFSKAVPQQFSTAAPQYNSRGSNNNQRVSTNDYQQYSSSQSANTFNNNQGFEQKPTVAFQQPSTARPIKYEHKSTAAPFKSSNPDDYDDGQYRPELYEKEAGGEYDVTARHNVRNEAPSPRTQEPELLRAAHSINIAASGNQLLRENRPQASPVSTTLAPVQKPTRGTTAQSVRPAYTSPAAQSARPTFTSPTAKSVYSNAPIATSAVPRPFSVRPTQQTTAAPPPKPVQTKQPSVDYKQSSHSSAAKPVPSSNSKQGKDVSYDYAYYDNSDHYSDYENIEEFRRTSKKQ